MAVPKKRKSGNNKKLWRAKALKLKKILNNFKIIDHTYSKYQGFKKSLKQQK